MNNGWKVLMSMWMAALTAYAQKVAMPIIVLIAVMALDWVSGTAAAWVNGELSSRAGIIGAVRKVGRLCLVAVGMVLDYIISAGVAAAGAELPFDMAVGLLVTFWLIINECISILENAGKAGVPIPEFLRKALKNANRATDIQSDGED